MPATPDCPRQPGPPAGAARTPAGADWLAQAERQDAVPTVVGIPTFCALTPGTRAGGYQLLRQLGAGGMGTVWEAVDDGGTHVAMKILHPAIAADPAARRRLAREAAVLARLRDPRVARVLDVEAGPLPGMAGGPASPTTPASPGTLDMTGGSDGPASDLAFVVTELVDGPTLQAEVDDNGPYDLTQDREPFRELVSGVVGALEAVHAAGVVHRDLKPSNVMLGPDGPVLIDFGISQVAGDARLTMTGQVTGTPGFIPPEVLSGASPDASADWFALAGVLLFTLTGRPPFGSGDWQAVFHRVYAGQPELGDLPERTPELAAALAAALSPDPARRLPLRHLLPLLDGAAAPAPIPPLPPAYVPAEAAAVAPTTALPTTLPVADDADLATAALPAYAPGAEGGPTTALPTTRPAPDDPVGGALSAAGADSTPTNTDTTAADTAADADLASTIFLPASPLPPAQPPAADALGAYPPAEATAVLPPSLAQPPYPPRQDQPFYPLLQDQAPDSGTPAQAISPAGTAQVPYPAGPAQPAFPFPAPAPPPPPGSRRHPGVVMATGAGLVAAGAVWPVPVMAAFTLWLLVSGTRGRASHAAWRRLMQTGETTRPVRTWLTMPWYLARAGLAAACSALLGWAAAVLLTWAGGTGAADPISVGARMSATLTAARWEGAVAATATLAFLLLAWLAPWNGPARRATADAVEAVAPRPGRRTVLALAFLAAAGAGVLAWWYGMLPAPDLSALLRVLGTPA